MSSLITIDWDYFMNYMNHWNGSYIENDNNINKHWYKKYYEEKKRGIDITRSMNVGDEVDNFCLLYTSGLMAYKKTSNTEEYFLGGRKLGSWVVSLSAQASDMSGWMLMGLPGAAYIAGLEAGWIALGLTIGTYLNWKLVAKRLRNYTEACNAITIPQRCV